MPKNSGKQQRRGRRRIAPLEHRAYYTRSEVCLRFGLSAKRLAEAVDNDPALPIIRNGRNQIFPKGPFESWFEAAAAARQNVHKRAYRRANSSSKQRAA